MRRITASPSRKCRKRSVKASLNQYYDHYTSRLDAMNDLIDALGEDVVLRDLMKFLNHETLEEFIDNEVGLYDLDDPEYGTYPYNKNA